MANTLDYLYLFIIKSFDFTLKTTNMEFKKVMTYDEMEQHLTAYTHIIPNRVTVGKYAKKNGYTPYKPMRGGHLYFYYVNEKIDDSKNGCVNEK